MSTNNANRQRVNGHPGIYRVGRGRDRYQARYRDRTTGKVVSRTFGTLEEAEAHKAAQVGFTYTVRALVNGEFQDAWPVVPVDDETAASWPEMQEYITEARHYDASFPASEEDQAELRRHALYLQLQEATRVALSEMLSGAEAFEPIIDGRKRVASVTLKVVRNPSDELDEGVRAYHEQFGSRTERSNG